MGVGAFPQIAQLSAQLQLLTVSASFSPSCRPELLRNHRASANLKAVVCLQVLASCGRCKELRPLTFPEQAGRDQS